MAGLGNYVHLHQSNYERYGIGQKSRGIEFSDAYET